MRMRGLLFSLLVAGACAPPASSEPTDLYEDLGASGGKADGAGLVAAHSIGGYRAIREGRIVTGDLEVSTFSGGFGLRASDRLLLVRALELDGVASHVVVDVDRLRVGVMPASQVAQRTRLAT